MISKRIDALYEKFETKERQGPGGKMYKYVPSEDIIDRMNKVFEGAWCVEIVSQEIIEDQILVKVRVYITDDKKEYWQEGFASHELARFSSGYKQGKPVNVGNDFKSATSKAIRTACARWGAGLYLEDEESYKFVDDFNAPAKQTTSTNTKGNPPIDFPGTTSINGPPMDLPKTSSTNNASKFGAPVDGPPMDFMDQPAAVKKEPAKTIVDNGPPNEFGFSSLPMDIDMGVKSSPPMDNVPLNNKVDDTFNTEDSTITKVSDVQKVAIQTILESHGLGLSDMLVKVFGDKNHVASINDLSYADGVMLIKEGNKLNRL